MISLSAALARIKRQKIEEFAGNAYVPINEVTQKIPYLEKHNEQQFLFGILESDDRWLAISSNYLFSSSNGQLVKLRLDTEARLLFDYFSNNDFATDIVLEDGRHIWMKTSELASLILNIMLMLKKVPYGVTLE